MSADKGRDGKSHSKTTKATKVNLGAFSEKLPLRALRRSVN
jgi:hypothetical protein